MSSSSSSSSSVPNNPSNPNSDGLLLEALMERLRLRPPVNVNNPLAQSIENLFYQGFSEDDEDEEEENEILDPYGREYVMQEERRIEIEIIRAILSGNSDSLRPNSGQSVPIRSHSICVGCGEEDEDGYIVWEWHGHIMAYDEQFGYSPEYIYGSYFQRVRPRQEAAPLADEEEEEIERGSQGLRDLIDGTNDSAAAGANGAAARILHRNVNASNPRG